MVIDEVESEVVKDIFKSYLSGLSVCTITKQLNEKNALNRNWRTTTIDRMLSNYIYAGNYQHRKRIQNEETILLEDVCPAIIDKQDFELVQKQKERNLKNYTRKHTYVYMQKIVCSKCNKIWVDLLLHLRINLLKSIISVIVVVLELMRRKLNNH